MTFDSIPTFMCPRTYTGEFNQLLSQASKMLSSLGVIVALLPAQLAYEDRSKMYDKIYCGFAT